MANLAIKGHPTRWIEVIEILEMLGGTNSESCWGVFDNRLYTINAIGIIEDKSSRDNSNYQVYTLEEFLEMFPYKIGDKVLYKYGNTQYFIRKMFWEIDKVLYELSDEVYSDGSSLPDTLIFDVGVAQLQPYKEETMDKANKAVFDANAQCCDIMNHIIKEKAVEEIKVDIPKGYGFAGVDDDNQQVMFTKIHPKYPKTFKECCEVLSLGENGKLYTKGYKASLIQDFHKLIICRDAYWKIAGDEMGLDKPWEPDYKDGCIKYTITVAENEIYTDVSYIFNYVLIFPTEEMRNAFYENFKDLIERCKELL